jgi:nitroreductase
MGPPPRVVPLDYSAPEEGESADRARAFYASVTRRRTVRHFSDRAVPKETIEWCLRAAGTAPSGANLQPWHFVAVSDAGTKHRIRIAAEGEEREFYEHRAPQEWLDALAPLGTDASKPFLDRAPWLIAVFSQVHGVLADGRKVKHYYALESVGIATGLLITAVHQAGLVSLTHTPSPMRFLNEILDRPVNEKPFLLLVVGYAEPGAMVPDITRKPLERIASWK